MSVWLMVYVWVLVILFVSAVPTIVECIAEAFNQDESDWNRHAALGWILFIIVVCFFWPVVGVMLLVTGMQELLKWCRGRLRK